MGCKIMLLRGLARGNGHWGDFPEILKSRIPDSKIELMEIPGNGTQNYKITPIGVEKVIHEIKKQSRFSQENEPFHLVAISLGGMVALKWAELYPNELVSASIINSSLKQCSPFYKRLRPKNYLGIILTLLESAPLMREKNILEITSNRVEKIKKFLNAFSEFSFKYQITTVNFFRQLLLANSISIRGPLSIPVNIVNSSGDRLVDPSCSEEIVKLIRAPLITHLTSGHDLPLDEPEWLCDVLCDRLLHKPLRILFLCVANSARSQLAEGLAKSIFIEGAIIESAGSVPSGKVQPWAIAVLKEQGIDISNNRSKSTEQLPLGFLENVDYIITLCADEICPVLPSRAKRLHWPIRDPAGAPEENKAEAFQLACEQIKEKILDFKKSLKQE